MTTNLLSVIQLTAVFGWKTYKLLREKKIMLKSTRKLVVKTMKIIVIQCILPVLFSLPVAVQVTLTALKLKHSLNFFTEISFILVSLFNFLPVVDALGPFITWIRTEMCFFGWRYFWNVKILWLPSRNWNFRPFSIIQVLAALMRTGLCMISCRLNSDSRICWICSLLSM